MKFSPEELEALGKGPTPPAYLLLMGLLALGVVATLVLMLFELSEETVFTFIANCALVLFALILHPAMRYGLLVLFGVRLGYIPYMIITEPQRIEDRGIAIILASIIVYHVVVIILLLKKPIREHFAQ